MPGRNSEDLIGEFYGRMVEVIRTSRNLFYRYGDDTRTYADLNRDAGRLAAALSAHANQKICVFGAKGYPVYCGVFATILSGNTWVPLNPEAPPNRNAEMLKQARPAVIVTDRDLPEAMAAVVRQVGIEVVDIAGAMAGEAYVELGAPPVSKDDLSMIYFTSGSTGAPKGVMVSHENYILNVENILRLIDFQGPEVFADYHDLGFVISVPVLFPCVMTASALSPGLHPGDALLPVSHMEKNQVSVLITVPSTIARIRKGVKSGQDIRGLNVLVSCGEPLHLDILEFALTRMQPRSMYNFYGSTEVAPWIFYHVCRLDDLRKYQAFGMAPIGTPIKGNDIRVAEDGELWIAGPQVTPGYLGGENDTKFTHLDGKRWYRMGDRVSHESGVYICKGRLDSQVKIGGYRVELMGIESHLRTMEGVESAVCFLEGEGAEKVIVAVLIGPSTPTLGDVRSHLKLRLPGYMLPRKVFCTADPALNKSGKIDRAGIRETYGA